jgi:hypothetical protein
MVIKVSIIIFFSVRVFSIWFCISLVLRDIFVNVSVSFSISIRESEYQGISNTKLPKLYKFIIIDAPVVS